MSLSMEIWLRSLRDISCRLGEYNFALHTQGNSLAILFKINHAHLINSREYKTLGHILREVALPYFSKLIIVEKHLLTLAFLKVSPFFSWFHISTTISAKTASSKFT